MKTRIVGIAFVFGTLFSLKVHVSGQSVFPSPNDLWDVSQGSVVTSTSGLYPASDARDMFGGTFSFVEPGDTLFSDTQPEGFLHFIEWQTPTPVLLQSFRLFAVGDGPVFNNEREFVRFTLRARSSPLSDFDLVLYTFEPTHPYTMEDEAVSLLLSANVSPTTSQSFRAEFVQFNGHRGFDGPRIIELDGFANLLPPTTSRPPVVACPEAITLPCEDAAPSQPLTLAVSDEDSTELTVTWSIEGTVYQTDQVTGEAPPVSANVTFISWPALEEGTYTMTVSVSDGISNPTLCSFPLQINDSAAPSIRSVQATPRSIWPPNHKMVPVTIDIDAFDACGQPVCRIIEVNSGGSNSDNDWEITGPLTLNLRAERGRRGLPRSYTVVFECVDESGNSIVGTTSLDVSNRHGE